MKRALAAVVQHLRIAGALARIGVVRKSQFKLEFWSQVLMDMCWYAAHIGVFEILYVHTPDIAGWSRESFRVLLGFLFVSDAFMMIWLGQMWRFGRDIKDGKLDPYRVRPASPLVLYALNQFSLEACVNMAFALGYLLWGIARALPEIAPGTVLLTVVGIALCCWARYVILTLFSILELLAVGGDLSRFVHDLTHSTNDRPLDVFDRRVRWLLVYIVPVGALTQVPASLVLGRYGWLEGLASVAWLIALGVLVFAAWSRAFRRYESAMG